MKGYKDLIVWRKAVGLTVEIYECTKFLPEAEKYGLVSQIRRSAVSIPSNIAEGYRRGNKADKRRFFRIALGSGAELETQIELVKRLQFNDTLEYQHIDSLLEEVQKMLNVLSSQ